MTTREELADRLRRHVLGGLHLGRLRPGDRLPGVRQLAEEMEADHRTIARAFRDLERDGLVVVRPRSGVYVAPRHRLGIDRGILTATSNWVARIASEGWSRRISLPELPKLVARCLEAVDLQAVCVEEHVDPLEAIASELEDDFGLPTKRLRLPEGASEAEKTSAIRAAARRSNLVVTTAFQAGRVQPVTDTYDRPLIVMAVSAEYIAELQRALRRAGRLTIVLVDRGFVEVLAAAVQPRPGDDLSFRFVDEVAESEELDPREPHYLTVAARRSLGPVDHPDLVTCPPVLAAETAREVCEAIVRLNLG